MNYLGSGNNNFVPADYEDLLNNLLQYVQNHNPFNELRSQSNRIIVKLDDAAYQISQQSNADPIFGSTRGRSATLNFTPNLEEQFPQQIRQIRDALRQHFHDRLNAVDGFDLAKFINPLPQGQSNHLDFTYNFPNVQSVPTAGLETRENDVGSNSLLKFHKLTISVNQIDRFQEQMKQGLENYLEEQLEGEELEDARDALDNSIEEPTSNFYRLQRIVDTESLGKLKREAKICYLEYLQENIDPQSYPDVVYLQDLIRRLRAMEEYINDPEKTESDYEVSYCDETINYKDWFSRSESLDALPIIPILSDSLGETTSQDGTKRTFTFGLKIKFGNPVQARGGEDVFQYYLNIIDPSNWEANLQESDRETLARKILRLLFLYYFVFATNSNPTAKDYRINSELEYEVGRRFDETIREVFQSNDEERKKSILRGFVRGLEKYKVAEKIKRLRNLLQRLLKRKEIFSNRYFNKEIGVRRGILQDDSENLAEGSLFKDVVSENPKKCLRYITVQDVHPSGMTFCQLPVTFKFEDVRYYQTSQEETFNLAYSNINQVHAVPILIPPNSDSSRTTSKNHLAQTHLVVFPYNNRRLDANACTKSQQFIYRFAMSLLFYITLRVLLDEFDKIKKHLFIPMLRFHEGDEQNPSPSEEFMADLSKVTAHLLNQRYRSNSQGIRIRDINSFKLRNAFASLYSVLPQTFQLQPSSHRQDSPLDKLALVVVSSLESDGLRSNRDRDLGIYTLFGEAIGITNQQGDIQIKMLRTFSQNYSKQELYREPSILGDVVQNLYKKGYRHILYIAQAPYSNNLNLTQVREETQFYFMSPQLIAFLMRDFEDIYIYPIFFNKYYVRKSQGLHSTSYSLQDTRNLFNLVKDPSQQVVVFFNLFNGITVGKSDERFYNGVMSYSTLLNIYPEVLSDRSIREGLIYNGSLKQDILRYLTLYHFFRLERTQKQPKLKLDPYEHIIGDESLRKNSLFYHMDGRTLFNNLAFLTEVNSILYPQVRRQEENS
ncbi:hypothetical protein [Geitlerinema sp. PCC 9228]|uniref:hypothetical protein n=1 Tax=Geitlerinema sp. PCC 9228 TaxID=111611 RepID=UPI0008F9B631|nr:hypothetical protein [Geitlerinema sp. PCC 9228]